jgi:hypothetical protein
VVCQCCLFPGEGEEQLYLVQRQRSRIEMADEFFLVVTETYVISFGFIMYSVVKNCNVNCMPFLLVSVCVAGYSVAVVCIL